jgi:Acetyltransferase (GNAT) family
MENRDAMEIKAFTVADLKAVLASEDFWQTQTLPITKHRALSYSRNPRADADDPVLLVAYRDSRVIGYLGILPDKIFVSDVVYKLGWLTSWWVDPSWATAGVGAILLFKALNAYDQYIGVSGSSREARQALQASQKFMALNPLQGLDIRLRLNAAGNISRRLPALKILRVVFKIFDAMADEVVNLRNFFWRRRNNHCRHLTFEYITAIDEQTDRFIKQHHQHDLTRKEKSDLSWIMNNPWILSAPLKDSASKRYYFSSRAARFSYLGVKVFEHQNEMIGFFLLKVRDDKMSVMYSFFESRHAASITAAAFLHALAADVSILSLYDEQLAASFAALGCPCWSARKNSRGFSLSKAFADIPLANYRLQGGDGDLAFY